MSIQYQIFICFFACIYAAAMEQAKLLLGENTDLSHEKLLRLFSDGLTEADKSTLRIIVDGSLEKICCDGSNTDTVIERLVHWLW